jgi:hypothetical protein
MTLGKGPHRGVLPLTCRVLNGLSRWSLSNAEELPGRRNKLAARYFWSYTFQKVMASPEK